MSIEVNTGMAGQTNWSVELHPNMTIETLVGLSRAVEDAGMHGVWVADSQLLWRDAYVAMAAIVGATDRISIGPGVTNLVTRHPSVVASALGTLQEMSDGRVRCGLGLGDSALETIGLKPQRISELGHGIRELRAYWAREESSNAAGRIGWGHPQGIPIYVGASGPRILELSGEVADGVIAYVGVTAEKIHHALEHVARGAQRAGREAADCDFTLWVPFSVSPDRREAIDAVKPHVARAITHGVESQLLEDEVRVRETIRSTYEYGEHMALGSKHAQLVPDELVSRFAVAGTTEDCLEGLTAITAAGVTDIGLIPMGEDRPGIVATFVTEILPNL